MKKIFLALFIFHSIFTFSNEIRSKEINKKFSESLGKIGELLVLRFKYENYENKNLDIGFYSKEKKDINEKIINYLKEYIISNKKKLNINIINENYDELAKALEKERDEKYEDVRIFGNLKKTKYLVTVKTSNYKYKSNFYLKEEIQFTSTIELTNIATGEVMISKTDKFDLSHKTDPIYVYSISGILFLLGFLISFITRKYYTLKIMFFDIIIIAILNIYFYML